MSVKTILENYLGRKTQTTEKDLNKLLQSIVSNENSQKLIKEIDG